MVDGVEFRSSIMYLFSFSFCARGLLFALRLNSFRARALNGCSKNLFLTDEAARERAVCAPRSLVTSYVSGYNNQRIYELRTAV